HALAEPVTPRRSRGLRQPSPRVVLVGAEQAGTKTDQHADTQHPTDPRRDRRLMQRTTERRPKPWPLPEPNGHAHISSVDTVHRARPLRDAERGRPSRAAARRPCEGEAVTSAIRWARVGLGLALAIETVLL